MINQRISFIVGIISMTCVLLFCEKNPSSVAVVPEVIIADNYESDNIRDAAKSIKPDSASQSRSLVTADEDWVSFSAIAGRVYKVYTTGKTDTWIRLYKYSGVSPFTSGNNFNNNLNAFVQFYCAETGKYFIQVSGGNESATGNYDLFVTSTLGADAYEPDSEISFSKSILTSTGQNRTMQSGDVDWVNFSISAADTILLKTIGDCAVSMALFDKDSAKVLASFVSVDSNCPVKAWIPAEGRYFIKITGKDSSSNGSYHLIFQTLNSGTLLIDDPYEDDNVITSAKVIAKFTNTLERSLFSGDTDWVILPLEKGNLYNLKLSSTDFSVYASVYSKDGSLIQTASSSFSFDPDTIDSVYVKIYSTSTGINYKIELSVTPYPASIDLYEDDNTREKSKVKCFSADSLVQNRSLTFVNTVADTDWIAFHVIAGKQYEIKVISLLSVPVISLFGDSSVVQTSLNGQMSFHCTETDTMYIMLQLKDTIATSYTFQIIGQFINDDYEPDSSVATAKILELAKQDRTLVPGDTDWVKYTALPGDSLVISTTGTTDTKLSLFSGDGKTLIVENDDISTVNFNGSVSSKCINGGVFYIRITGKNTSTTGLYSLQVFSINTGTPVSPDSFENDNTRSLARTRCFAFDSLSQNRTLAIVNTVADTDWVAFPVTFGKQYTIQVTGSLIPHIYLYDKSSVSHLFNSSSGIITFNPTVSDTMYLMILSPESISVTYSLNIHGNYTNDNYEPDSSSATAKVITNTAQVRFLSPGDTDWIAYTVEPGDSFIVSTTGLTDTKLSLFSVNSSAPITDNDDININNTNASISCKSATGGQFYIRVTGKNSTTSGSYTVQVLSVNSGTLIVPDKYENDNTRVQAKVFNDAIMDNQEHSLPAGDTDWVAFPVIAGGSYTFSISGISGQVNTSYYRANNTLIDTITGIDVYINYKAVVNDTVLLRITSGSSIGRYTVSKSWTPPPAPDKYEYDNNKLSAYIADSSFSQSRTITAGDTDWVSVPLVTGRTYSMAISNQLVRITILNKNDMAITTFDSSLTYTATSNDTFYCRIVAASPTENPIAAYVLTLNILLPDQADSIENGNSDGTAKTLFINRTSQKSTITAK